MPEASRLDSKELESRKGLLKGVRLFGHFNRHALHVI
jgi:hypothetical protein